MKRFNDMVVYRFDGANSTCVFTKGINSITSIDLDKLNWHKDTQDDDDDSEYLTLQEIGDQVRMLSNGYMPVLYVWVEGTLHGAIYQTGNYLDDNWILHGETQGYA